MGYKLNLTKQQLRSFNIAKSIIIRELKVSEEEATGMIMKNPEIIEADLLKFQQGISNLIRRFNFDFTDIQRLILELDARQFNMHLLYEKEKLCAEELGLSTSQFGVALRKNPLILKMSDDDFKSYITAFEEDLGVDRELARNLILKTSLFGRWDPEETVISFEARMDLLNLYGITKEQIIENPGILGYRFGSIDAKVKLAQLMDVKIEHLLKDGYISGEEKIYAKYMAMKNGVIDPVDPYLSERWFFNRTGTKLSELVDRYPLTNEAIAQINNDYALKYPNEAKKISVQSKLIFDEMIKKLEHRDMRILLNHNKQEESEKE